MNLCKYGCGQEGKYKVGRGGWSCSKYGNQCPVMRKKISEGGKGKIVSPETRRKLSEINKGKIRSEEHRKNISEAHKGRVLSKEHKRKIGEAQKGERNHMYGKTHTPEARKKISEAQKGEKHHNYGKHLPEEHRNKIGEASKGNKYNLGRKHTEETRKKISEAHKGKVLSEESRINLSCAGQGIERKDWEGFASKLEFAIFKINGGRLYQEVRRDPENPAALQVRCTYSGCKAWFTPTGVQVRRRIGCIEGKSAGDSHLYCSEECKGSCCIFNQRKYPKGFIKPNKRNGIVESEWRDMIIELDDHKCQKCGATENLEAHHIKGVIQFPMLANDLDNGICVCHDCHKNIHSQEGCTNYDYQRVKCDERSQALA